MLKRGRFAVWNMKEYRFYSYNQQYYLESNDPADLENDFERMKNEENSFIKQISVEELSKLYEVIPYVMLEGYRFSVESYDEKNQTVSLVTNNPFVKEKLNVKPYGKHDYIITMPLDDVYILEDKLPIFGFEQIFQ